MNSMEEPVAGLLERKDSARLAAYLERVVSDERLLAVLICDTSGARVYATNLVPADVTWIRRPRRSSTIRPSRAFPLD